MKRRIAFLFLLVSGATSLFGIVGDWVSYGSRLDMKDLHLSGNSLRAASRGGLVTLDLSTGRFGALTNLDHLEHIDIQRYYVNSDGSEWYSYSGSGAGISMLAENGQTAVFDYGFNSVNAFSGNNEHVLAAYKNEFTPEIAHFVKTNNRYIFQDNYNQFPDAPENIYDIAIVGDSIFFASELGLYKAWLYHANLKPENAWTRINLDSSSTVLSLGALGDSLFFVNDNNDLYCYYSGNETRVLQDTETPLGFARANGSLYYASARAIYRVPAGTVLYRSPETIGGFCLRNDTLWVAPENKGILRIEISGGAETAFMPNTMMQLNAKSLAITDDHTLLVCGLNGLALLEAGSWHNLVFSPFKTAIRDEKFNDRFSADTLNIAYQIGGQTATYDAMISSAGEVFCSITDISARPVSGQSPEAEGPGALMRIDLNDYHSYQVYDTSGGVIEGTQELGGSEWYLKMRGLQEDAYGNVWALNVHTIDAQPLIRIRPDGTIQKYSVAESGGALQILAREMVFDRYGRLWIANEARQADVPRTTGGITVFDQNSGVWALITTSDGLASNDVYSLDMDPLTGNIWAATAAGVQMIRTPSAFDNATTFSMNPKLDGLSGMVPVKIRIDPKGNKWILTQSQGVQIYLSTNRWFNDGSGLTTANSALLDNVVYDLVFDTKNGYAYLLTATGLSRYEIAWTEERETMDNVIIFPQPFSPGDDPYLAIDGIADQSHVRIAMLDGRVVKQFSANSAENKGKQLVWDGKLDNGNYLPRGVYLAFITNIDGLRKTVKFAVK